MNTDTGHHGQWGSEVTTVSYPPMSRGTDPETLGDQSLHGPEKKVPLGLALTCTPYPLPVRPSRHARVAAPLDDTVCRDGGLRSVSSDII